MSKKISVMPEKTALVAADEFTILDSQTADPALKNKRISKTNALIGVTQDPPAAGNNLRNQATWVAAGGAAVLNVGTTAGTVAAGDAPASAVAAHTSAYNHTNIPTAAQKGALDASPTASSANAYATANDIVEEGADLKSTGQLAQKILVTDGAGGFAYEAKPAGTGGLTAVEDDPAPRLGGNLELVGNRIMVTDATDQFHGALGYSPTVQALFLSENIPGEYFEERGGISFQNGLTALHGTGAQIKAMVGIGDRQVYTDPDGNLYPVEPPTPAWDEEDSDAGSYTIFADVGTGPWVKMTGLSITTTVATDTGVDVRCTTRAWVANAGATEGAVEFGWGVNAAEPTVAGIVVPVAPYESGYVNASKNVTALMSQPSGTVVQAWARRVADPAITFGCTLNGNPNNHNLLVEVAGSGGAAGDASSIQGVNVTGTAPADGDILVYRTASAAYVLEAKPAAGSNPSAADVSFTPVGTVAASNVQAAIAEVASEAVQTTRIVTAGDGLTGGGALNTDVTLAVGAGTGISVLADAVSVLYGTTSTTAARGDDLRLSTNLTIANAGASTLDIASSTGTDATIPASTATTAGLATAAQITKLNGIATGATAAGATGDAYAASHEADTTAHTAANIVNVPAGTIAATTVQAALNELDTDKSPTGHTHTGVYATAAQGTLADSAVQPGDPIPVADINLDGATDIGADLADADLILVDDGAVGTNRKSALSRVWTYINTKITAGIAPLLNSYKERVHAIVDGAAFAIDPNNGSIQTVTLGASRSPTATNFAAGHSITLMVNDGTAYAITWPSVVWVGGSPPVLASTGYTIINLWKVGTTLYGMHSGDVA